MTCKIWLKLTVTCEVWPKLDSTSASSGMAKASTSPPLMPVPIKTAAMGGGLHVSGMVERQVQNIAADQRLSLAPILTRF